MKISQTKVLTYLKCRTGLDSKAIRHNYSDKAHFSQNTAAFISIFIQQLNYVKIMVIQAFDYVRYRQVIAFGDVKNPYAKVFRDVTHSQVEDLSDVTHCQV